MTRAILLCANLTAAVASAALSGMGPPVAAAGGTPPLAFAVAEPPFAAELAGIDGEWNVSFKTGGKLRVVAAADLAYWGRYQEQEAGPHVMLADGGLVRADLLWLDQQRVVLGDATGLGRGLWDEAALPRHAVRGVVLQPPADVRQRDRMWIDMAAAEDNEDQLLLSGGETLSGTLAASPRLGRFASADQKPGVETFELFRRGREQPLAIPAGRVVAVRFGRSAAAASRAASVQAWLGLSDGSLVCATAIGVKGDVVTLSLAAGGELKTTLAGRDRPERRFWDAITYLEPAAPRRTWLSDLPPLGFKQIPFLSVERGPGMDRSVLLTRLRAAAGSYRKGIGMPSASRLAYDVAGYRKFAAELSVDEVAGLCGSVVFKVALQPLAGPWEVAYESPVLRGGDSPLPVSVDLGGAQRMALLVEFADRGDECDYANWLMARVLK